MGELKQLSNRDEHIVKDIEYTLEHAKSLDLRGVIVIGLHKDNDAIHYERGGLTDRYEAIGALEYAKQLIFEGEI